MIVSCKKTLDAGISTTISGIVYDNNSQRPIPNHVIHIDEFKNRISIYGPKYNGTIDSTISDSQGKYTIKFLTTGQGSSYTIGMNYDRNFYNIDKSRHVTVGKDTIINFYATKLHDLKMNISVLDNPNPPLIIIPKIYNNKNVWGTNNDTILFFKIIPNQANIIEYSIRDIDSPSIRFYEIDTINLLGFQDTFEITVPVSPKKFYKRK